MDAAKSEILRIFTNELGEARSYLLLIGGRMKNGREDGRAPPCLQVWLSLRLLSSAKPLFRI